MTIDDIAWEAYRAFDVAPDLTPGLGLLLRPVTFAEYRHILQLVLSSPIPGPLRFTAYIGPPGHLVTDEDADVEQVAA